MVPDRGMVEVIATIALGRVQLPVDQQRRGPSHSFCTSGPGRSWAFQCKAHKVCFSGRVGQIVCPWCVLDSLMWPSSQLSIWKVCRTMGLEVPVEADFANPDGQLRFFGVDCLGFLKLIVQVFVVCLS